MKKLGFIALLIFGSLAAQAQSDPQVDIMACKVQLQLTNEQVSKLATGYASLVKENERLAADVARLKEELKQKQEKPSN